MTDFINSYRDLDEGLKLLMRRLVDELMEAYPDVRYGSRINLRTVMSKIYAQTKRQFVVVIDEWDVIFRQHKDDEAGQKQYLDFLRDWMKDKPYIALAYMTGILPIKKHGEHSSLNMFTEYSMMAPRQLAPYMGFTAEEVQGLCERYHMRYDAISDRYNGYRLSNKASDRLDVGTSINEGRVYKSYCPLSVVECMMFGRLENYWNKTETYEALAEYIRRDYDGLKDAVALLMDGGRVAVDTSTYQNDTTTLHGRDDVLSLLIHLGYLGYDDETSEVFVPNREILDEFRTCAKVLGWSH